MIDNDNEVSLVYLLEPTFQMMNTAGKPLTDGYLEVYIHGTRDRYYCSSDFDGTLHPFKVPLDSLGSNIVLVSPFNSYDIYVYNKYGSLQMSRYNVTPGSNWVDISGQEQYFIGEGQLTVDASLGSSSYLLDNLTQIDGNLPVSSGNLELPDECLYNVEANFEFEVLNYNLLNQDVELSVEIKNPCRVTEHTNTIKGFTTINTTNVNKNTLTLCGLIYGGMDSLYGTPHLEITFKRDDESTTPATIRAHLTNISVYKIAGLIGGQGGMDYNAGPGINIEGNLISVTDDVAFKEDIVNADWNSRSGKSEILNKPDEIYIKAGAGIHINASNGELVISSTGTGSAIPYFEGNGISIDNHTISTKVDGETITYNDDGELVSVGGGQNYTAGQYISIDNNVISASGLQPAGDYATVSELNSSIQVATALIPDVSDFVTNSELNSVSGILEGQIQTVSASIPDVSDLATKQELQTVSSTIPDISGLSTETYVDNTVVSGIEIANAYTDQQIANIPSFEQVNADWNAVSGVAEILHKPTIYDIKAGEGIIITESANTLTISATPISGVSGYYVTESELNSSIQAATALIPDVSDFVTNGELNTVSGILEGQIQNVSASIPDVSDFATKQELQAVSSTIPDISGLATEAELQMVSANIPDISGLATEAELQLVSAAIPDVSGFATETYVADTLVSAKNYTDAQISNLPTPVNADWEANSGLSQILNKPTEKELIPGRFIDIDDTSVSGITISVTGIEPQYNSDWEAVSGVTHILNKPIEKELIPGNYISLDYNNGDVEIAVTGVQPAGNYLTSSDLNGYATETYINNSVSGYATQTYVNNAVSGKVNSTNVTNVTYVNNLPGSPVAGTLYLIPEN